MARPKLTLPKPWTVELRKSRKSGWLANERTGRSTGFICYDGGTAGYDHPGAIPKSIRARVITYCKRLRR